MEDTLLAKVKQAALDLEERGYAIIPDVFSSEECREIREKMWKHMADISDNYFTPDRNYAVEKATALPAHKHGIIESWRFNHLSTIREIRRDERLVRIYALLYGTDQLTASIDRVNFKFPGRTYRSLDVWPHVDQHPSAPERISIQSYVTFLDCEADSPGNRFYDGSHAVFGEFFKDRCGGKSDGWTKLTEEDKVSLPKQCPLVKPVYKAGSLVLWDSRTAHSPSDGTNFKDGRFVVYVCYNKLWEKKEDTKFWEKKKAAFIDCRSTSHSPLPQKLFGKTPRKYDKPEQGPYDEIPKDKLGMANPDEPVGAEVYLFGFKSYGSKEGMLLGDDWRKEKHTPLLDFVSPFSKPKPTIKKKRVEPVEQPVKKSRSVK